MSPAAEEYLSLCQTPRKRAVDAADPAKMTAMDVNNNAASREVFGAAAAARITSTPLCETNKIHKKQHLA
jgi:hypothetical protein